MSIPSISSSSSSSSSLFSSVGNPHNQTHSSLICSSFFTPQSLPYPTQTNASNNNKKNKNKRPIQVMTLLAKTRDPICFQTQYMLSTASPSTSIGTTNVLDVDEMRIPSLQVNSDSLISDRPWTYTGAIGPPTEANYGAALATETLLTSEEAVIAAAAAEAVTLAKAALKVAKDVASNNDLTKAKSSSPVSRESNVFHTKWDQNLENEQTFRIGDSTAAESALVDDNFIQIAIKESEDTEPSNEEFELLHEQLSNGIAAKSKRQMERKIRRARAAEKAAASVVTVKSRPSSRKKRASSQDVDHSDQLRYFKATTISSKLLTSAEEIELSQGIQELLKLQKLQEDLTQRCGSPPTFAQWSAAAGVDQKTLRKRLSYGTLCKDRMIKSNIRLVISIAKNFLGAGMNLQDLVQEGCRGLVKGAEKFDGSKGFKFSTYAHWWIKQSVRKFLSDQSRTIRLPFHMVERSYRVKEARKELQRVNGRDPTDEEVAEATGLSMKRLSAVLLTPKAPISLDQKVGINLDLKPSDVTADPEAETAEDILMKKFMKQDLEMVLNSLNAREKQVIRWRFGLEDGRMKTLQEIGELMGVSRERIRQIESCAFRKLKNKKRTNHLHQYVLS